MNGLLKEKGRAAAARAAREAVVERARKAPEVMMAGILRDPQLLKGLHPELLDQMFTAMLEAGKRDLLVQLADSGRLPSKARGMLVNILLF